VSPTALLRSLSRAARSQHPRVDKHMRGATTRRFCHPTQTWQLTSATHRKLNNRQSARRSYQRRRDRAQRLDAVRARTTRQNPRCQQRGRRCLWRRSELIHPLCCVQENNGLRAALQQISALQAVRQKLDSDAAPQVEDKPAVKADTPPMRVSSPAPRSQPQAPRLQIPMNDPHGTHLAVQTQLGTVSTYRFDPSKHAAFGGAAGISPAFTPPGEADSPQSLSGAQPGGGSVLPQTSVQYFPWAHVREGPGGPGGFNAMPWQPPQWMAQQQQQMAQMVAQQALAQQQLVAQQQLQQAQLAQQQLATQQYMSQQAAAAAGVPSKKGQGSVDKPKAKASRPKATRGAKANKAKASSAKKNGSGSSSSSLGKRKAVAAAGLAEPLGVAATAGGALNAAAAVSSVEGARGAQGRNTAAAAAPTGPPLSPDKHSLLPFETDLDLLRLGGFDFGEQDELGWSDEVFSLGEPIFN
jgi:hypothetical protein